jgi:RNase adaptor protein for sRNA GlmZ degradation
MNKAEKVLYHLKQRQTYELSSRFSPNVAQFVEQSRDLALVAWGCVGGGKQGQALLEVLMEQISAATNTVELLKPKRRKQ